MANNSKGKRANGDGTIRKRTVIRNGKPYTFWEGTITVGTDTGSGKLIRQTFTGKKQDEVAKKMRAAASEVDKGGYAIPTKLTVKEWFEIWLSEYMGDKKPLTVQQYRSMSETHIYPALGAVKLSKLTAPQLQKFYNQLAVDGMTTKKKNPTTGKVEIVKKTETRINPETGETETVYFPLSTKSIRNIHGIICKALNVAVSQGMIKDNVSQRVTVPKTAQEDINPLTEEQQKALLVAIQKHKYETLYTVILFSGLREGEAIGLTWDCIDFKKGTMKVYRQLQRTPGAWSEFRFVPLKNSKTRVIKLSPFILEELRKLHTKQRKDKLAAGELWKGFQYEKEQEGYFVFTDKVGEHLKSVTVYNNFKKLAAEIGVPEARVHDLRHTFAVNSLQCGDDVKTVQDALGHATAAFTLDVYGHVSERMMEEHAARQEAFIARLQA